MNRNSIRMRFDRLRRFVKFRILHANDSPHSIALGVAIGVFVGYMPALGFQMVIAIAVALWLKANKFAAGAFVWISNPFTIVAIYYPNYVVGRAVSGFLRPGDGLGPEELAALFESSFSWSGLFANIHSAQFWQQLGTFAVQIGTELLIGGVIIGGILALISYFATYHFVIWHRKHIPIRHRRKRSAD